MNKVIAQHITNYNSNKSIGSYFRRRRSRLIIELIKNCYQTYNKVNILDIGGRPSYWNIIPEDILDEYSVHITLINNSNELGETNNSRFTSIVADGCNLEQYTDQSFQFAHSNSVIEHVGNWKNVIALCNEMQRLAPSYYVQTPNYWFPFEPHFMLPFFHWLPKPIRAKLLTQWTLGHINQEPDILSAVTAIEEIRLMDNAMFTALFKDAKFKKERFLGLPKSLIAYKHAQ
jgi:hypothetical protein